MRALSAKNGNTADAPESSPLLAPLPTCWRSLPHQASEGRQIFVDTRHGPDEYPSGDGRPDASVLRLIGVVGNLGCASVLIIWASQFRQTASQHLVDALAVEVDPLQT